MSSKPSKGKQQNMSLEEAAQKYDVVDIFEYIDSLESRETDRNRAGKLANGLKTVIINYNRQIEIYKHITDNDEKIQERYETDITKQIEVSNCWKELSEHQRDLIETQSKLIMALEDRDKYIRENYDIIDVYDSAPDGDGGEGDEEE